MIETGMLHWLTVKDQRQYYKCTKTYYRASAFNKSVTLHSDLHKCKTTCNRPTKWGKKWFIRTQHCVISARNRHQFLEIDIFHSLQHSNIRQTTEAHIQGYNERIHHLHYNPITIPKLLYVKHTNRKKQTLLKQFKTHLATY